MKKKEWLRKASNGVGEIYSAMYIGEEQRALVHIVHGMREYSGRYEDFARFLTEHGYVVVMEDHQGHGHSARISGHFGDKDGWKYILQDLKKLTDEAHRRYPGLPIFMLGHSMGSFLVRSYVVQYPEQLDALLLSGTMGSNPTMRLMLAFARLQKLCFGPRHKGRLLQFISGKVSNRRIDRPVNGAAWLSRSEQVCLAHRHDRLICDVFSLASYIEMFKAILRINRQSWFVRVPRIPIYIFSGSEDPIGNYGRGPSEVCERLRASGHEATLKLYPGARHETLNELNKDEVYRDVLAWLDTQLARFQAPPQTRPAAADGEAEGYSEPSGIPEA